ncbi:MAG: Fic family protein [Alkalimonas sp.]|nr:Fic family protein [Alkalimonas sp.]
MDYTPPFRLTHKMISVVADLSEQLGRWTAVNKANPLPYLRRENRIRTIQASLAVEQNTLSLEQVTAVLEGKHVLGTPKEILEVQNAFAAYELLGTLDPCNEKDLLSTHKILMRGLVADAGRWRSGDAGIYRGEQLVHMAPPASQVPRLLAQLCQWLKTTDAHPLIASSAFHYEFEFIHPFSDGNGRMGRLWQTIILSQWQPILAYLPVETVIKQNQEQYYEAFRQADSQSDCTAFIEFLLGAFHVALTDAMQSSGKMRVETGVKTRVEKPLKTPQQILIMLSDQPDLSIAQLALQLGRSTSTIERAIAKLKQQNKLLFEGPKKSGRWRVL